MKFDITGIGTPMIDFYTAIDKLNPTNMNIKVGECNQVNCDDFEVIKNELNIGPNRYIGGSVYNTLSILGQLELNVGLGVEISKDLYFKDISEALVNDNIKYEIGHASNSTGKCLVLLDGNKERSFISSVPTANVVKGNHDLFNTEYLLIESYILSSIVDYQGFLKDLGGLTLKGTKLILSLSDVEVIKKSHALLKSLFAIGVDIVFGNESEYEEMLKMKLASTEDKAKTLFAITKGQRGVTVLFKNETTDYESIKVNLIDKNGAGDAFAAGFIYGLITDKSLNSCVYMGQTLSCAVISKLGPKVEISKEKRMFEINL